MLACTGMLFPRLHLYHPWSTANPESLIAIATAEYYVTGVLLFVWALGAAAAMVGWGLQIVAIRRTLAGCRHLPIEELKKSLGSGKWPDVTETPTRFLVCDTVDGPFCLRFHRPTIVLPRMLLESSPEDLRNVILHELAHIKNNHPLQLFLQQMVKVLCWFHPMITYALTRASLVREFSCDEAVIGQGVSHVAYLRTLARIAERCCEAQHGSTIGFGKSPSEIVARAKRVVETVRQPDASAPGFLGKRRAIALVITCGFLMSLVCIPADTMSSTRSSWSAWPSWTASCLFCFNLPVRDYERFDRRVRVFEQLHEPAEGSHIHIGGAVAP
jgi:beta-lactamase regulating signal transducer with metallopeptidase domain